MAKIHQSQNGGFSGRKTNKDVNVNSYNVDPTELVAVPDPGTVFPESALQNYEFFNVSQTGAATDEIILSSTIPVGTVITLFAVDAFSVGSEASSGIGINGGTDAQEVAVTADSVLELKKISSTNWVAQQTASSGAITAPSPA